MRRNETSNVSANGLGSKVLAVERFEPCSGLIDAIGFVVEVVARGAGNNENVLLFGSRLVEQFEAVTVGTEGSSLAATDGNL